MNALYFKPFDTDVSCLNAGVKGQEYLEGFNNFMVMHDIKDDNALFFTWLENRWCASTRRSGLIPTC
jgi:hypothetical protein